VGVWLVFAGINFEPQGSTLTEGTLPRNPLDDRAVALAAPPPVPLLAFEVSPRNPSHITGFKALLVDLKF
jgi:hypothetical protein